MICLMMGSSALCVFAADYDDPVDVVLQYSQRYDADSSRSNDYFSYKVEPVDGAPAPAGSEKGVYYFSVKAKPGKTTTGNVELSMTFPSPGEYKYKVSSYVPKKADGFTYDSHTYTLHVYVQNNDNGGLKTATVSGEDGYKSGVMEFTSGYKAASVPGSRTRPTTTPTGDGTTPAPAARGAAPAPAVAPDGTVLPEEEPPAAEPTPIENIVNDVVPKADPDQDYWALLNLLAAVATVLTSAILVVRYAERIDTEEDEYIIRRKGNLRLLGLIPSVASVITFVLTENLSLPMELADEWTPFMLVVLAIDLAVAFIAYRKYDRNDEGGEAMA